jgi:hypothetical protein
MPETLVIEIEADSVGYPRDWIQLGDYVRKGVLKGNFVNPTLQRYYIKPVDKEETHAAEHARDFRDAANELSPPHWVAAEARRRVENGGGQEGCKLCEPWM